MQWILDNPELSAGILTSLVLVIALIFARWQLKDMAKDRHAQILLALSMEWSSEIMQKARKDLASKFLEAQKLKPGEPEIKLAEMIHESMRADLNIMIDLIRIPDFFEDIGLLVNKKMIHPPELILEIFAGSINIYWEKFEKLILTIREDSKRDDVYEWFEYLYRLSKAYSEAKTTYTGSPENRPSANKLFAKLAKLFK